MIAKGKTKSGFEYAVETSTLSSWEYTKLLAQLQKKKSTDGEKFAATMDLVQVVLGEEQVDALVEHLGSTLPEEELVGGVQTKNIMAEFNEIFDKVKEKTKN